MQNLGAILLACGLLTAIGKRDHTRGLTFLASILVFLAGLLIVLVTSSTPPWAVERLTPSDGGIIGPKLKGRTLVRLSSFTGRRGGRRCCWRST